MSDDEAPAPDPWEGPAPLEGESARDFLKRVWEIRAINTLGQLLKYTGRQAMVAQAAARTILEHSNALNESRVDKLVEDKFKALVDEARRRIEARNAGAKELDK